MQTKVLEDVVGAIAGKPAVSIVDVLYGKKNVNEFLIAKKLGLTINQTRNMLYRLSDIGLVRFIRKKDKRKGWYTYFWTLNLDKVYELIKETFEKEIINLKSQLKSRKEKRFYVCKTCHVEVSEESALLHDFTCGECGEVYELNTDIKMIKEMQNKIAKLSKEVEIAKKELVILDAKKVKQIEKELKKEKAEKAKKRAERRKEREKLKKKEERIAAKGKSKKKTKKKDKKKSKKKVAKKSKKKVKKKKR